MYMILFVYVRVLVVAIVCCVAFVMLIRVGGKSFWIISILMTSSSLHVCLLVVDMSLELFTVYDDACTVYPTKYNFDCYDRRLESGYFITRVIVTFMIRLIFLKVNLSLH